LQQQPLQSRLLHGRQPDQVLAGIGKDRIIALRNRSPLNISDVWKNSTSANTNHKIWAAKFAARHPNLIPVELSNFKCGHDAFVSGVIEQIIESAGKPYFCFRDLDENKPLASLRIRIETMHYFLKQYTRQLERERIDVPSKPATALPVPVRERTAATREGELAGG